MEGGRTARMERERKTKRGKMDKKKDPVKVGVPGNVSKPKPGERG